jgi:hypothetical protein
MSSRSRRTTIVAFSVALAVVAVCLAGAWGEYLVSRSHVPAPSELQVVAGDFESCEVELNGQLGPMRLLQGAWGGPSTHILTLQGVNARFRTQVFDCGTGTDDTASVATRRGAITLNAQRHPVETAAGEAPLYNAYGLTVNGVLMRTPAEDLADHRRAHDVVAPLNIVGLLLLAVLLPGLLIGALRGHLWQDDEMAAAPRDSKNAVVSSENSVRE